MNYTPITVDFSLPEVKDTDFALQGGNIKVKFRLSYRRGKMQKLFFGDGHLGQRISNRRM